MSNIAIQTWHYWRLMKALKKATLAGLPEIADEFDLLAGYAETPELAAKCLAAKAACVARAA